MNQFIHLTRPWTAEQLQGCLSWPSRKKAVGKGDVPTKRPCVLQAGVQTVPTLVENKKAQLVVIAQMWTLLGWLSSSLPGRHCPGSEIGGFLPKLEKAKDKELATKLGHQIEANRMPSKFELWAYGKTHTRLIVSLEQNPHRMDTDTQPFTLLKTNGPFQFTFPILYYLPNSKNGQPVGKDNRLSILFMVGLIHISPLTGLSLWENAFEFTLLIGGIYLEIYGRHELDISRKEREEVLNLVSKICDIGPFDDFLEANQKSYNKPQSSKNKLTFLQIIVYLGGKAMACSLYTVEAMAAASHILRKHRNGPVCIEFYPLLEQPCSQTQLHQEGTDRTALSIDKSLIPVTGDT
ncbi:hypothetical protein Celaphus_00018088, partial [Cervus elaphus hippelaphus]